jgi:hypothetical protein
MIVNSTYITIGAARAEGRAPSHDGEHMTLAQDDQGRWLLENNAGLVGTVYGDTYLDACGDDATEEDEAIQAEIDAWLALPMDPDGNVAHALKLGRQGTECVVEWGWLTPQEADDQWGGTYYSDQAGQVA